VDLAGWTLAVPLVVEAQPATKSPRLGYLFFGTRGSDPAAIEGLREGLRGFGYVENQNIVIEYRYASGQADRLPGLVSELISLKIDVLITQGTAATAAAKGSSAKTPVVFVALDRRVRDSFRAWRDRVRTSPGLVRSRRQFQR
jgi:ABC-type uncharacterized transport system substrate-binding protein